MAPPPLILLPPSEGKATGGDGAPWAPGSLVAPDLDDHRAKVMAALKTAMRGTIANRMKLLGVKGDVLAAATEANRLVTSSPTCAAIDRYTGVLYGELAYGELPARLQRRVDAQVLIFSGLWGVVAPTDPIPDYKLKMGGSLSRLGKLSTSWRPGVSAMIDGAAAGRTVWNLLPQEHAAAWASPLVPAATPLATAASVASVAGPRGVITVRFLDEMPDPVAGPRATKLVAVNHWNKLLKGALVRHIVAEQLSAVEGVIDFRSPHGYDFRPDLTVVRPDGTIVATLVRVLVGETHQN